MDSQKKSFGLLIAIIIIIVVVLGAIYFWMSRSPKGTAMDTTSNQEMTVAPVSSSDDVDTLDQEINTPSQAPDLSNLNGI